MASKRRGDDERIEPVTTAGQDQLSSVTPATRSHTDEGARRVDYDAAMRKLCTIRNGSVPECFFHGDYSLDQVIWSILEDDWRCLRWRVGETLH